MEQVEVLYDFDAEPGSSELSIRAGEVLTVLRHDVGEGWLEGSNQMGQNGLFPEAYVQPKQKMYSTACRSTQSESDFSMHEVQIHHQPVMPISSGPPPAMPLPPLPTGYTSGPPPDEPPPLAMPMPSQPYTNGFNTQRSMASSSRADDADDFRDDWSDDDDYHSHGGAHARQYEDPSSPSAHVMDDHPLPESTTQPPASILKTSPARGHSTTDSTTADEPSTTTADEWDTMVKCTENARDIGSTSSGTGSAAKPPGRPQTAPSNEEHGVSNDGPSRSTLSTAGDGHGAAVRSNSAVRRNINIFSNFVKSGAEAFILDTQKVSNAPSQKVTIRDGPDGPLWEHKELYSCMIATPKKSTKLKGLKSFIAYQLTPSFNNIQVSRRYKHFDWLHQRLEEKFTFLPVPPLPEKQVSGRYEDEFIEHRMQLLQMWTDKIARHPVLGHSDVWMHFITCTDEKQWKSLVNFLSKLQAGKRAAERDEYTGGMFFKTVDAPCVPLEMGDVEKRMDNISRFAKSFDESLRIAHTTMADYSKRMQGPLKKEYQKLGGAFGSLSNTFKQEENRESQWLSDATSKTSKCYEEIAGLVEAQPRKDLDPLMDLLYTHRGLVASSPDVLHVYKSATAKLKDHADDAAMRQRVDTLAYALLADANNSRAERVEDFSAGCEAFLGEQITFYQNIVTKLQDAQAFYRRK